MSEKKENRDKTMIVRLTKSEYDLIKHLANLTNLSTSQFVRKTILEKQLKVIENLPVKEFKNDINKITKIGNAQKKFDDSIIELVQKNLAVSDARIVALKKEQDEKRAELLFEIAELKKVLIEMLKGMR